MKKKSVVKIIATFFVLLTGLILFSPKSVSASAITIKAAFDKKYYNVNSTKKAYSDWVGNVTFFTRHTRESQCSLLQAYMLLIKRRQDFLLKKMVFT